MARNEARCPSCKRDYNLVTVVPGPWAPVEQPTVLPELAMTANNEPRVVLLIMASDRQEHVFRLTAAEAEALSVDLAARASDIRAIGRS